MNKRKLSRRNLLIGGGLACISYLFFQRESIAVTKYNVLVSKLPSSFNGFTILHISDLHSKEFGDKQKRLLNLINRYKFDMVAITGDIVDKDDPKTDPAINLIQGLPKKPVYFVPGNHEWWTQFKSRDSLIAAGVHILENANHKYSNGDNHIWVVGVDDPYLGKDDLEMALEGTDDSTSRILLAHAPNIFSSAIQSQIDHVMVGHTHGGQVRLPFIGVLIAPGQGLFPKLDYGLYSSGDTTMVINGGLGESVLPIRFNNRPEIVLITLKSKNND